ncbi:hypothetical protein [Scopulibacillus cellulosilyticus]|uniref:Uncharacterized protein n=1 Tax=Scopulibacillus cellulosilyticus TaxID=2665665 RepID=A0ABW2PVF7_9BACL
MPEYVVMILYIVGGILAFLALGAVLVGSEWFGSKRRKQDEKAHRELKGNYRKSIKPKPE